MGSSCVSRSRRICSNTSTLDPIPFAASRPSSRKLDGPVAVGRRWGQIKPPQWAKSARRSQLLDEAVDLSRTDAVDVGLLDDGDERLLGAPGRLEERGEVRALAQLRNLQLDLTGAGVPLRAR
jgi:hypothetical protein